MKNFFSFEDNPRDAERRKKDEDTIFFLTVMSDPWKKREPENVWDSFFGKKEEKPKDKGFFNW